MWVRALLAPKYLCLWQDTKSRLPHWFKQYMGLGSCYWGFHKLMSDELHVGCLCLNEARKFWWLPDDSDNNDQSAHENCLCGIWEWAISTITIICTFDQVTFTELIYKLHLHITCKIALLQLIACIHHLLTMHRSLAKWGYVIQRLIEGRRRILPPQVL